MPRRRMFPKPIFQLSFAAVLLASPLNNRAGEPANLSVPQSGLSVQADANAGDYRITAKDPAWTFGGSLGAALKNVRTERGHDGVGDYQQIAFEWQTGPTPMTGQIRLYEEKAVALFSQTCGAATEMPPAAFPAFTKLPEPLHIFSYGHRRICAAAFFHQ